MKAVSINKMGIGFFDDGIDPDKNRVAIALGDSFTRGMGSTDIVKYGWVELAENTLRNLDIINMGNSGSGTKQ